MDNAINLFYRLGAALAYCAAGVASVFLLLGNLLRLALITLAEWAGLKAV